MPKIGKARQSPDGTKNWYIMLRPKKKRMVLSRTKLDPPWYQWGFGPYTKQYAEKVAARLVQEEEYARYEDED